MTDFTTLKARYSRGLEAQRVANEYVAAVRGELQATCAHRRVHRKDFGDGGSYYDSASYWTEHRCLDCGKVWTTAQ